MDLLAAAAKLAAAAGAGQEELDLDRAARSLERDLHDVTRCELARLIAEAAVLAGCRSFAWAPTEAACAHPRCTCHRNSDHT